MCGRCKCASSSSLRRSRIDVNRNDGVHWQAVVTQRASHTFNELPVSNFTTQRAITTFSPQRRPACSERASERDFYFGSSRQQKCFCAAALGRFMSLQTSRRSYLTWALLPSNMIKYSTSEVKINGVFDKCFVYNHTHSLCSIKQSI